MWQFRVPEPDLLCRFHVFSQLSCVKCRRLPLILRQNNFIPPCFFEILPHFFTNPPYYFATVQHCVCESARKSVGTTIMRTDVCGNDLFSTPSQYPRRPRVLAKVSL